MRPFRERDPFRLGVASLIVVAALLLISFGLNRIPFIAGTYPIEAEFADAAGLSAGDQVRIAGIKVGVINGVELLKDRVLISMKIERGTEIPKAATAEISLNTILGTKFVSIDAKGEPPLMTKGDRIPMRRTIIPFEIFQAANATVDLLTEIDPVQLNQGFRGLAEVSADPGGNLRRALDGASEVAGAVGSQSESLNQLIARGNELLETLNQASPELQALISSSSKLLDVISKRRETVRSLIRNTDLLARSVGGLIRDNRREIDSVLHDLHLALIVVDRNLSELEEALKLLGPSTESFARVMWTGPWANICVAAIDWVNGTGTGAGTADPVGCDPTP